MAARLQARNVNKGYPKGSFASRVPFSSRNFSTASQACPNLCSQVPDISTTAPAPNAGAVRKNEPDNVSEIESTFHNRAKMVLHTFATHKTDHLILGAWGCGVFHNDPKMVADMWQSLLGKDGRFEDQFKSVVFAIYDPRETSSNREEFEKRF